MKLRTGKGEAYLNIRRLFKKTASYSKRDPEVSLVLARKTTEAICKFVYYTHVSENTSYLTLEKLLTDLSKNRIIPRKILTPMRTVQSYGNFGAHDQEDDYEEIDETYALPCLSSLEIIMKWFQNINSDIEWALTTNIHDFGLSKRTIEILRKAKLISIAELCTKVENDLLKVRGIGIKTIFEIKAVLLNHGLSLGTELSTRIAGGLRKPPRGGQ